MMDDMYSMCCSFPLPAHRGTPSWSTVILAVITRVPVCREGIRKQKTQSDCEASWFVCLFLVAAWGTGSRSLRLLHLTPCFDSVRRKSQSTVVLRLMISSVVLRLHLSGDNSRDRHIKGS